MVKFSKAPPPPRQPGMAKAAPSPKFAGKPMPMRGNKGAPRAKAIVDKYGDLPIR